MSHDVDALIQEAFALLRAHQLVDAKTMFQQVLHLEAAYSDAHYGIGLTQMRLNCFQEAMDALRKAHSIDPTRIEFKSALDSLEVQQPPPVLYFRVDVERGFERFEKSKDAWEPLFLKGINLGAALPGKFPSEFPEDAIIYSEWIRDMVDLGVNTVRVYTLHPAYFYEALHAHNAACPDRAIYLVQGVWAELPGDHDMNNVAWYEGIMSDAKAIIDTIHQTGMSPWVAAYILGREWEADCIHHFNTRYPGMSDFEGLFIRVSSGEASEVFMGRFMNDVLAYEHYAYGVQRPMAFCNWATLDPLTHITESTFDEQNAWRVKLGMQEIDQCERSVGDDSVSLDMEKMRASDIFRAGLFVSYHAYPYFPDFLNNDPIYLLHGHDHLGPNSYMAYLRDLVRHHKSHAVVISEFGIPSSRLIAHTQPQGMHHGGHSEKEQGNHNARMLRNIYDAGCAGAIMFACIDEWFKQNWLSACLEVPPDRKPLWFNPADAEENYGLIAYHPGVHGPNIVIDGKADDWDKHPVYTKNEQGLTLKLFADEGWLHLAIFWPDIEIDFDQQGFLLAICTNNDSVAVDHAVSLSEITTSPTLYISGCEKVGFLVRFQGDQTCIRVRQSYGPYSTSATDDPFVMPVTRTDALRIGRDGTVFPGKQCDIGWLRHGTLDRENPAFDSRAEWCQSHGFLEARIPWNLLNVTDPSQRRIVNPNVDRTTCLTQGFRIALVRFQGNQSTTCVRPVETLPNVNEAGMIPQPPLFSWDTWETPTYHKCRKQSFTIVQHQLGILPTHSIQRHML